MPRITQLQKQRIKEQEKVHDMMAVHEVASLLGLSKGEIYKLINQSRIPVIVIPAAVVDGVSTGNVIYRFERRAVLEWYQTLKQRVQPTKNKDRWGEDADVKLQAYVIAHIERLDELYPDETPGRILSYLAVCITRAERKAARPKKQLGRPRKSLLPATAPALTQGPAPDQAPTLPAQADQPQVQGDDQAPRCRR